MTDQQSAMTEKMTAESRENHENPVPPQAGTGPSDTGGEMMRAGTELSAAGDEMMQAGTEPSDTGDEMMQAGTGPSAAEDDTMYIDPAEDALNASETLRDMAVGLAFCAAVLAAAGSVFLRAEWYRWVFGVLLGTAAAGLMLRHLYVTIDRALDMDADHASKYMKKSAVLRILMAGAALAAGAFFPEIFHVFGVFAGVLCLKFSAYLQPLTHKAIKFLSKGR